MIPHVALVALATLDASVFMGVFDVALKTLLHAEHESAALDGTRIYRHELFTEMLNICLLVGQGRRDRIQLFFTIIRLFLWDLMQQQQQTNWTAAFQSNEARYDSCTHVREAGIKMGA